MPSALVVDTHTTIWYLLDDLRLSDTARRTLEDTKLSGLPIHIPSITFVEIIYLIEKSRFGVDLFQKLIKECEDPESVLQVIPLDLSISIALAQVPRDLVPDMPDRIIAATALELGLPLVTKDSQIRSSGIHCIW